MKLTFLLLLSILSSTLATNQILSTYYSKSKILKQNPYLLPKVTEKLLAILEENEVEDECVPSCVNGGICESGHCFCRHPHYGEACE